MSSDKIQFVFIDLCWKYVGGESEKWKESPIGGWLTVSIWEHECLNGTSFPFFVKLLLQVF